MVWSGLEVVSGSQEWCGVVRDCLEWYGVVLKCIEVVSSSQEWCGVIRGVICLECYGVMSAECVWSLLNL